ncbi:Panacea domain-containing protein [Sphingomonas sp. ABOLH]|uniref:Panacea domain-containing protein n=1 Tax=Sphingomonas sp. ABOLH TaxID=1985881 RepID=UPI000F7DA745|nr:Panacea domain-containing protein [Sphingomonas sp. ABOLH]RSV27861.1 DUF4065 domain-containing protein [Sphingomonas sp. ABOLH]
MTPPMDFKDLPTFVPRKQKLLAAILLLIEEASSLGLKLTTGEIVKSLFLADDRHLADFGRPITFDNYVAMKNGPVGDTAVDMLNDRPNIRWSEFGVERAPWLQEQDGDRSYYRAAGITADRRKLSPSDIDALRVALDHVTTVGFGKVSIETHAHPAWASAWLGKAEGDRAAAMDWRDFPMIDAAAAADLAMASANVG